MNVLCLVLRLVCAAGIIGLKAPLHRTEQNIHQRAASFVSHQVGLHGMAMVYFWAMSADSRPNRWFVSPHVLYAVWTTKLLGPKIEST